MKQTNRHSKHALINRDGSIRCTDLSVCHTWPAGACMPVTIDMITHYAGFKTTS